MWALGDQLGRGFVVGATAGRTTLNGEGLQHEDGHSPLIASTNPACVWYDPAWAFEVGHIFRDGLRRMYGEDPENIFYYLTVYNEPYLQPAQPEGLDVDGLLKGLYRYAEAPDLGHEAARAQILASGVAVTWALEAQELLAQDWGVAADIWSATSWTELRREALACDAANLLDPDGEQRVPYVTRKLAGTPGPVIAVSDYMRAVQDQIRPWVQHDFRSLGTDGFGMSDTRGALRRYFKVDAASIVVATLEQLARQGGVKPEAPREAVEKYQLGDIRAAGAGNTLGES
jgi:pyruvate dehydrogenase E1 component